MKRIVPVAIAVIYNPSTKKLLLTQRKEIDREDRKFGHCWNFPGGGIEFGEDPIDALHREVKEELGIEVDILRLLPKIFSPVRDNWHGLLICYLCVLKDTSQKIKLNHESVQYGWFTLEEIHRLRMLPLGIDIAELSSGLITSS